MAGRINKNPQTHKLSVASRSRENAFDMGVMASFAVFSVNSSAPVIIVVSSCVKSPPFPAYMIQKKKVHTISDENL